MWGFSCAICVAEDVPYVQVTKDPVSDVIPYASIPPAIEFLNKYDLLSSVSSALFFRKYSENIKDLVIYDTGGAMLNEAIDKCAGASSPKVEKISFCAKAAAINYVEHFKVYPQEFGYKSYVYTGKVSQTIHGDYLYIGGEDGDDYTVLNMSNVEIKRGVMYELKGLLSSWGDYSYKESLKPFSREFVVKEITRIGKK